MIRLKKKDDILFLFGTFTPDDVSRVHDALSDFKINKINVAGLNLQTTIGLSSLIRLLQIRRSYAPLDVIGVNKERLTKYLA